MKRYMIIVLGILISMSLSASVFAGNYDMEAAEGSNDEKKVLEIGTAEDNGGILTYTPSPSTIMACSTTKSAYTITSASKKTTEDNGVEYGIISADEGYYQRKQADSYKVEKTDSATKLPGDNWKDKDGKEPPTPTTPTEPDPEP